MRPNFQGALSPQPPKMYAAPSVRQDRAAYRILKPCFLDDTMYFEGQLVYWDEEPNSEMEPLNEMAKKASRKFFDERERLGQEAAQKRGTLYVNLQRPFKDGQELNTSESRRVELVRGDGGIPVMGARKSGRPKAERIDNGGVEEAPIADAAIRAGRAAANATKDPN